MGKRELVKFLLVKSFISSRSSEVQLQKDQVEQHKGRLYPTLIAFNAAFVKQMHFHFRGRPRINAGIFRKDIGEILTNDR